MEQNFVDNKLTVKPINETRTLHGNNQSTASSLASAALLWNQILDILQESVGKEGYTTWLAPTKALDYDGETLTIEVPNAFFVEWIGQYYLSMIAEASKKVTNNELHVIFRNKNSKENISTTIQRNTVRIRSESSKLQERYAFDSFVIGECNHLAYAASKAVAENLSEIYNPLLIYGGVGLGKTHLLHAIGNHAKKLKPHIKVYYTPAENLFIELIQAIERGNTLEFKNKYRSQDLLLIDDVHYLKGKERLQEEIFHIFNNLYNAGKQVAFTSDRPPHEIPTLEERLTSRLQAGLVVDLQPPDLETRIAILCKKADKEGYELNSEVAYYIASRVNSNIRQLEGCLIRLIAISSIEGRMITLDQAKQALNVIVPKPDSVTTDKIVEKVAKDFNIRVNDLKFGRRTQNIALARQVAMYLMRKVLGYSLKEIGVFFGGKDHTTVMYACEKIEKLRNQNQNLDNRLRVITLGITGG